MTDKTILVLGLIGAFAIGSLAAAPVADAINPTLAALIGEVDNMQVDCQTGQVITGFADDGTPACVVAPEGPQGPEGIQGPQGPPGIGMEIIRFDGGRSTQIHPVELYFLESEGVFRNIPSDFELASTIVGADGTISEVQYKIGKSNTSGESVTARIYKNNMEIGSCNLVTSTSSHSSCTMTLSESVVKSDLLAMSDIVNADSWILVEGKSAFVAISIS